MYVVLGILKLFGGVIFVDDQYDLPIRAVWNVLIHQI